MSDKNVMTWVSVDERLPDNIDDVLAWDYDEPVRAYYRANVKRWMVYGRGAEQLPTPRITHWCVIVPPVTP